LRCPFGIVVAAEDSNLAEAVNFGLQEREERAWDLISLSVIRFHVGIRQFEMDGFAGEFSQLA
jgi:hypothetical protein